MILLASSSPRRRQLLTAAGIDFDLCEPGEEVVGAGAPIELAAQRAVSKAWGAPARIEGHPVLGADTVVECAGVELGKPRDRADARRMLELLAGREHAVHTGHCLVHRDADWRCVTTSRVRCEALRADSIEGYLDRGEWSDKAGGYGIQAAAGAFMKLIEGDLDTVVGLSVCAVRSLMREAGIGGGDE